MISFQDEDNEETLAKIISTAYRLTFALVAQLDRVSASEAECRVFESPRAHQT